MTCCKDKFGNALYLPINTRLLEMGKKSTAPELLEKYPDTAIWLFSFFNKKDVECPDCFLKFQNMVAWFDKFGLLKNPVNNIKWIFEDDMDNNLICRDMGLTKSPVHIICNKDGNILDVLLGFPDENWLKKFILPMVNDKII
jgi:hypothetical protein